MSATRAPAPGGGACGSEQRWHPRQWLVALCPGRCLEGICSPTRAAAPLDDSVVRRPSRLREVQRASRPNDGTVSCVAEDREAQLIAQRSLDEIVRGYQALAQLDLPEGAAGALTTIQNCIKDLEGHVRGAMAPLALPWVKPPPEEQAEWERLSPGCGSLLRQTVCVASEGSAEEWFVGRLLISDAGLLFEGGAILEETIRIGFLEWGDIEAIENQRYSGSRTKLAAQGPQEVQLLLRSGVKSKSNSSGRRFSFSAARTLRLQLGMSKDCEWLEEVWRACTGSAGSHKDLEMEIPDEGVDFHTPALFPNKPHARPVHMGKDMDLELASPAKRQTSATGFDVPMLKLPVRGDNSALLLPDTIMSPYAGATRSLSPLPSLESALNVLVVGAPQLSRCSSLRRLDSSFDDGPLNARQQDPVYTGWLPKADIAGVKAALESDEGPILAYLEEGMHAYNMSISPWSQGCKLPGTLIRRARFRMPLPSELPRAVAMLASLPESSAVTVIYRLRLDPDEVLLVQQTCTHDVPFGENFRVQEKFSFRPHPRGGVELRKWSEVVWVAPLSWTYSPIKRFVESKAMTDCKATAVVISRILEKSLVQEAGSTPEKTCHT